MVREKVDDIKMKIKGFRFFLGEEIGVVERVGFGVEDLFFTFFFLRDSLCDLGKVFSFFWVLESLFL